MMDILGLGYVVVQSRQPQRWRAFGEDVLGAMVREAPDGALYLKFDERAFRILVVPGAQDGLLSCGWELADKESFHAALQTLPPNSTPARVASNRERALRQVTEMACLLDPSGNRHELFWGPRCDFERFDSPQGVPRFVMGALGMGHVVLPAPEFDATWAFFRDVLGFGLSDTYTHQAGSGRVPQRLHFAHCRNVRHHSVALFETELPHGCGHVMVELDSLTEVGRAMDRMRAQGVRCMASLGEHVNDRMTSFYMLTPSGFSMEIGCGGPAMDWSRHSVFEATAVSLWGHDWSMGLAG